MYCKKIVHCVCQKNYTIKLYTHYIKLLYTAYAKAQIHLNEKVYKMGDEAWSRCLDSDKKRGRATGENRHENAACSDTESFSLT